MNNPNQIPCPVQQTLAWLNDLLTFNRVTHPRGRMQTRELLRLVEDIATGRAGEAHLEELSLLADELAEEGPDAASREAGREIADRLKKHSEIFWSHVGSRICPDGQCIRLTPAPCQMACPAGIDIPGYLTLIGQGKDAEALELIRKDNPFPWVCGLVCTNPCELKCIRAGIDQPVSIKYLKGFVSERVVSRREYINPPQAPDNGHKVAIIGAGPAGLTAAYYLALKGYRVTIIEGLPVAGGMMMVGIPRYRLPREVINQEVGFIASLGVEFRYNTYLGQDVTIDQLRAEGFGAFFIAMGAHSCLSLMVPGEHEFRPVISAVDLLRQVALEDQQLPGRTVAVVGGGNVAIDAARTCLRQGANRVTIVYRRSREEMPANPEEIQQAEEEGINFCFLTMPLELVGRNGRVTGLKCLRTDLGPPDASGRCRPICVQGSEHIMPVDAIIAAIGQVVHPGGLTTIEDMEWSPRGTLLVDPVTMTIDGPGVFTAGGDIVTGPATIIQAIAAAKRAAEAIDRYFSGEKPPQIAPVPVRRTSLDCLSITAADKMALKRPHMPLLSLDRRRVTFQQVELGYPEDVARAEARRCLRCDICARCGTCVTVCRDEVGVDALKLGYLDPIGPGPTDLAAVSQRCIGCGSCAVNCPTGAMNVSDQDGYRVLTMCGTELQRLPLVHCPECQASLGPARYLEFTKTKTAQLPPDRRPDGLCPQCARKRAARMANPVWPPEAAKSGN